MDMVNQLIIWTDGGARGNPGPAGIGAVIATPIANNQVTTSVSDHDILGELSEYIGQTTNNQAEYLALVKALEWTEEYLKTKQLAKENIKIQLYTDSELMAYQIIGKYKVKNEELKPLYLQAFTFLQTYESYTVTPIRREKNQVADKLVNKALDAAITQTAH